MIICLVVAPIHLELSPDERESSTSPIAPIPSDLTFTESSVESSDFLGAEKSLGSPWLLTYKLVGDNIDKNVCPREM